MLFCFAKTGMSQLQNAKDTYQKFDTETNMIVSNQSINLFKRNPEKKYRTLDPHKGSLACESGRLNITLNNSTKIKQKDKKNKKKTKKLNNSKNYHANQNK
jgi:hypothetical protein